MPQFTHRLPHAGWSKPSRNEEEYFHREHFLRRMELARKREEERAAAERAGWLREHGGRCPRCGSRLEEVRESDLRVEQCPTCLGVWMEHSAFDRMTHPEEEPGYLAGILRDVLLAYTTGELGGRRPPETV